MILRHAVVLALAGCGVLGCPVPVSAQFPVTITLAWDANPAEDQVTAYLLSLDGGTGLNVSNCEGSQCTAPMILPTSGGHIIRLVAVNAFGQSPPAEIAFTASAPGRSSNLRIILPTK